MHIGLVVPGFSANENDWCIPALRNLVGRLATTDAVRVIALRYPEAAGRYQAFGARVIALGGARGRRLSSTLLWGEALRAIAREHRARPFDVLHAFWATESGALTAVAGRLLGVPTIVSLAGGELVSLPDLGYGDQRVRTERWKVGLALRLAGTVTAGSRAMLDLAAPWLRSRPVGASQRIPLGVDLEVFRPAPGSDDHPLRLVHAASLVPVKDQATLLRAVATLHARGLPVTLGIAGAGPGRASLEALARQLRIESAVTFHGAVRHEHLAAFYGAGDLFVLSSRHEAQGMAPLEAAAIGRPVVGTRVGVIPELAPGAGRDVAVGDHRALAEAIAEVLESSSRRDRLGRAARAQIENEFSLERSVDRFRSAYAAFKEGVDRPAPPEQSPRERQRPV